MRQTRLRMRVMGLVGLVVTLACAMASGQTTMPADGSKFLRFVPDSSGGGRLEASIVTYGNADGVTVDLIAAVHVADIQFFAALNQRFDQYDSLLYEMVKPRDTTAPTQPSRSARPGRSMAWVGTLQRFLKDSLGLAFQLEEIDYDKPNFVHADLDLESFLQKQEERGETMLALMLRSMVHEMSRGASTTRPARPQPGLADLLLALQAPDRQRQLKLVLARQFNEIDAMMAGIEGPDGSVILTERNKAAINVLKDRIAGGDRKLGVFYGAAHLKGIEQTMIEQMGFRQVGPPQWGTAWDMTAGAQ